MEPGPGLRARGQRGRQGADVSPPPSARVRGAAALDAGSRGVEARPSPPGALGSPASRGQSALAPGTRARGFPAGAPRGPAGKKGRQGTALDAQSRRVFSPLHPSQGVEAGDCSLCSALRTLSKELREGTVRYA